MAWPTSATVASGATITAAGRNALRSDVLAINGYVLKTADESVTSSAVLQNDDHLLFTIAATGTYIIDAYLYASSATNTAGDLNVAFSFPTGTMHFGVAGPDTSLAASSISTGNWAGLLSATSGTTFAGMGLSTSVVQIHLHGILVATATGTLRVMWSQNASNANATTVKAGSHLLVKQVA